MKLNDALNVISAPKGLTSLIDGIASKDYSVLPHKDGVSASLQEAEDAVAKYEQQLRDCQSDWAYWSILGDLKYWKAVRNILNAADMVGADNLPDVEFPKTGGLVVMDAIGKVTDYGEKILSKARQMKKQQSV